MNCNGFFLFCISTAFNGFKCIATVFNGFFNFCCSDKTDTGPERMFLHAYKLEMSNALENLDICSGDPFADLADFQVDKVERRLDHKQLANLFTFTDT